MPYYFVREKGKLRNTSANNKIHRKWMTAIVFIGCTRFYFEEGESFGYTLRTVVREACREETNRFPCCPICFTLNRLVCSAIVESVRTFFVVLFSFFFFL